MEVSPGRCAQEQRVVPTKVTQRDELFYLVILHTSLSDKSIYYCSCAKNIAVMFIERNCPTLSQTSSIKLSYIKCGILHFRNIGDCIKEYCNMTSRFACDISAVVYKRNIPPV